jgi:hypothetical protein
MTISNASNDASAYLAMAQRWRAALTAREAALRPHLERFDRSRRDGRMPVAKQMHIAEDLVRAANKADHEYEDRLEGILTEYRRLAVDSGS